MRAPSPKGSGPGRGTSFEAATWHMTFEFVRELEHAMTTRMPPSPADLAMLAAEIERDAANRAGEMPLEVQAFVQRYGAPDPH